MEHCYRHILNVYLYSILVNRQSLEKLNYEYKYSQRISQLLIILFLKIDWVSNMEPLLTCANGIYPKPLLFFIRPFFFLFFFSFCFFFLPYNFKGFSIISKNSQVNLINSKISKKEKETERDRRGGVFDVQNNYKYYISYFIC